MLNFLHLAVTPPDSSLLYMGHYDPILVGLSIMVAILASYAALLVAQHVSVATVAKTRRRWLALGGICMGIGIWTMHFVGMLAFSLPCGSRYDPVVTVLSMIPGILASVLTLKIISRPGLGRGQLASGGLLAGAGIGTMHYSGMAAMHIDGLVRYDLTLFLVSVLVAVALATLAIWIRFRLQVRQARWGPWTLIASAVAMGLAVSGMHYTGMAAAYFISDGNRSIVDSQITPTFLASMTLAATGALIVLTMAASYVARPNLFSIARYYKLAGLLALGWLVIAWLSADYYSSRLAGDLYRQVSQLARQQADMVAGNVDERLERLENIALAFSYSEDSHAALRRFGADVAPSALTYEVRRQRWTEDRALDGVNHALAGAARQLKVDNLFIVNAAGDCIAAANAGEPGSPVGMNFADWLYFPEVRAGRPGRQYAVGRTTHIPGLYYAYPVLDRGRFIGAIVVKQDMVRFADLISRTHTFVVDANGVIILASDQRLEFHSLPDAAVVNLSEAKKRLLYKRSVIEPLAIVPWGDKQFPGAVLIGGDNRPAVLIGKRLMDDAISLYLSGTLAGLSRRDAESGWIFLLLAVAGGMLIVATSAVVFHLRESKRTATDLRVAAAAFEVQEGMMITDARCVILRVNQAFSEITGYPAEEAVGETPGLLRSDRHDADFYAAIWAAIGQTDAWQGEIWNRRKNGEVYPVWLTITAVKNADGEVINYVGTLVDISQRKAAEDAIKQLAFYDTLTGLPNRRLLTDRLNQAMMAGTRSRRGGALLFIDLDNFKTINDTLGHDKGDQLLKQVAERLVGSVREGDSVARFGGDEFVVLLENLSEKPETAAAQTKTVAEKILATLNRNYQIENCRHYSSSSIGAAMFSGHGVATEELLKQADLAMYQAKAAGRNVVRFFDSAMQTAVTTRAALEADLRQGLQRREFCLYYQPQVDCAGHLTGVEALVRWRHPERGLVLPDTFISLAEDTRLILPLGHWVLETACAQLAVWAKRPESAGLTMAVNVSARQFRHPDFVDQVLAIVDQMAIDPSRLKLEITESLLLDDVEDVIAKMTALKAHGIGFSLDDFGTGYSSLAYLKRLPLDQLKIDRSFVRDVLTDQNDAAIARAIVTLARSLDLSVIAEGVETEAQRDLLYASGCITYQGYLFGKPAPIEAIEPFLVHG